MGRADPKPLPAWMRQPGESYADYERRRVAENAASAERRHAEFMAAVNARRAAGIPDAPCLLGLAVGVGTYDANGVPKGSGWQ